MNDLKIGDHVVLDCTVTAISYIDGKIRYTVELDDGRLIRVSREELDHEYKFAR